MSFFFFFFDRPQKFGRSGEGQIGINLENGIGHHFGSTFKLVRANKRNFNLELQDDNSEGFDLGFYTFFFIAIKDYN